MRFFELADYLVHYLGKAHLLPDRWVRWVCDRYEALIWSEWVGVLDLDEVGVGVPEEILDFDFEGRGDVEQDNHREVLPAALDVAPTGATDPGELCGPLLGESTPDTPSADVDPDLR